FLLDADLNHRRPHEIGDRLERLGQGLYRFLTLRRNVRGGGHTPKDSRRTHQGRGGNQNRDPSYRITFHSLLISFCYDVHRTTEATSNRNDTRAIILIDCPRSAISTRPQVDLVSPSWTRHVNL